MRPSGMERVKASISFLGIARAFLVVGEQRRVGRARAHHVRGDAVARMLARHGLGEGATSPPLQAAYTASPEEPTRAASEAMLTMRPALRAAMPGSTAWCMCSAPVRLMAISFSTARARSS